MTITYNLNSSNPFTYLESCIALSAFIHCTLTVYVLSKIVSIQDSAERRKCEHLQYLLYNQL